MTSTNAAYPSRGTAGFTLIELLVVVGLIALVSAFALPSVTGYFKLSINSATRDIATTVKESYNSAAITGKVHRLVYDLKEQQYWVESGPMGTLLDTQQTREKEERRKRFAKASEAPPPSPFALEKSVTRKKISLPRGVSFEDIVTQQSPEPLTTGTAYTHFFSHGFTEQTLIHLTDESKHQMSLVIAPLLGRSDLYPGHVTSVEAFGKK